MTSSPHPPDSLVATAQTLPPDVRKSVFISYASADRAVARRLREGLLQAGLDVWLDEEEIVGGEAWDAKIRQQIHTCDYFMPLVSSSTEARSEGYFRREWRLAVERTMDFADDVLFLVPVVIDETVKETARVPEKFNSVQWLHCGGGQSTPALENLAARLASGAWRPDAGSRLAAARRPRPSLVPGAAYAAPRPIPVFPAFPASNRRDVFVYEVVVWVGQITMALWLRLPRWVQVGAGALIILRLIGSTFGEP